jgi:hypothetical protein
MLVREIAVNANPFRPTTEWEGLYPNLADPTSFD